LAQVMQTFLGENALNHLRELAAHDTSVRAVVTVGTECSFAMVGTLKYSPDQGFSVMNKEAEVNFRSDVQSCSINQDSEVTRLLTEATGVPFACLVLRNGVQVNLY